MILAGQDGPYLGACALEALSWASQNRARLSPVIGNTYSASCSCDLCVCRKSQRVRNGGNTSPTAGTPIPAGQEWIMMSPVEIRTVIIPDKYVKTDKVDRIVEKVEVCDDEMVEVCDDEKKEKLSKAAKRKERMQTLDAVWEQFQ